MEKPEKKESALDKINKIITAICAFLLVLVFTDIRNQIADIRTDVKAVSGQYMELKGRVTILEYVTGFKTNEGKKGISNLNKIIDNSPISPFKTVFTKPDEYEGTIEEILYG